MKSSLYYSIQKKTERKKIKKNDTKHFEIAQLRVKEK
jgi:hypothetical protein